MKNILTLWLRLQVALVYKLGYCVDASDGFSKIYAVEADGIEVVGVFD